MKEQWQRKKAPLSEQESINELMKKKKEKREPQKDSKKQLSIKGSGRVPKEDWQHGRQHTDNSYIFVKEFNKHTLNYYMNIREL